ncbi:MAG: ABC transporter permease [Burkholderiales bacterium]|jgi:spermidine/putrescine transport system permease protein
MFRRWSKWFISGPPLLYLVVFFAIPTLIMLVASFRHAGPWGGLAPLLDHDAGGWRLDLTLDNYRRVFADLLYVRLFVRSFVYALVTTVLCLLMAYPLSMFIARSPRRYRDLLVLLVILPFWSNFLIRIYAWIVILGPQSVFVGALNSALEIVGLGPVRLLYTPVAVVIGLVYVHLPFMILPLYATLEKLDPALLDAAQDLGAGAWNRFRHVIFPLSLPGVYAGAALVFIPAFGIFAIPDLLGGTGATMIGNVIKQQFLDSRDWPFGSVLSAVLTVLAVAIAGAVAMIARRSRP